MNSILDRIKSISDKQGVTVTNIEQKIGASKGVLSRALAKNTDIQSKWLLKIVENYPRINPTWLLTGDGPMLKDDIPAASSVSGSSGGVPLVGIEAVAGFGSADFSIRKDDILDHYLVPDFKEVDFMLRITGDSMHPTYNGGDVVGCLDIKESQFLQWGRVYLLATRHQGLLVKRIKPGSTEGSLTCVSDNDAYGPFEVQRTEITGIALVVGTIRLE